MSPLNRLPTLLIDLTALVFVLTLLAMPPSIGHCKIANTPIVVNHATVMAKKDTPIEEGFPIEMTVALSINWGT